MKPDLLALQHSLVVFAIHHDIFWKKVQATTPQSARKTPLNHNTIRVFYRFDGVVAVELLLSLDLLTLLLVDHRHLNMDL
jgi:hypothetical protein